MRGDAMTKRIGSNLRLMAAVAGLCVAGTACADFVESSRTIGAGRTSFEARLLHESDDTDGVRSSIWRTPFMFIRGLDDHWDLRVESDGFIDASVREGGERIETDGFADLSVGLQYHVPGSGEDGRPSMGWLLHVDLASGSSDFRGDGARPSLRFVTEWELGDAWNLGVKPGIAWYSDANGRFAAGRFGALLAKAWSERFSTFGEIAFPQIASDSNGGTLASFNAGASWMLADEVTWNVVAYKGLNERTPDLAVTTGLAFVW
jgi:hypothetical protein